MSPDPKNAVTTPLFQTKAESGKKKAPNLVLRIFVAVTLLGALGGTGWWWFFGSKPRLLLAIPIPAENVVSAHGWRAGESDVALLSGGKLTILSLKDRQQRWVAALPMPVEIDGEWQEVLAKRFLKLQRWSEELSGKRAKLNGNASVKAFNAEAARYAAELALVRADSARKSAPPRVVAAEAPAAKRPHALGEDRSDVDKLKAVRREDETMLRARITKRTAQLLALRASIAALGQPAGNPTKAQQLSEQAGKLKLLEQEQKQDEAALAPKPVVATAVSVKPAAPPVSRPVANPGFAVLGELFWLAEGSRLIGFDRVSGSVKRVVPMPGPVIGMVGGRDSATFVARVGASIRYAVSIGADGKTQTVYMPYLEESRNRDGVGREGDSGAGSEYSEVFGGGGLALASIQFVGKKNEAQPVAESSADKLPTVGESTDGASYRVSVRRPLASSLPVWQGDFPGRVQFFSTTDLCIIVGGKKLVALNSNNVKLWESVLTAPALLGDRSQSVAAPAPPCFANGDRLYFSDRAGLTAFNAATGEVIWRLSSIGIRKVTMDGEGFLYVQSANLPIDSHSHLASLGVGEQSVVIKVKPADGMPVWTREKLINVWASGKDVYALAANESPSAQENQGFPSGRMPGILKLSRGSGKQRWEWSQPIVPSQVFPMGKTLAIFYSNGLQLISSTAL